MKKYLLSGLIIFSFFNVKSQENTYLGFKTSILNEVTRNFTGGISCGTNFNGRLGVSMGMDTEKAGWWEGGYLFFQAFAVYSGNPSANEIGDIQPISRIEATDRIGLFEFWYRQDMGPVQLLIGQHDMNAAFGVNKFANALINTSFGMYPSIGLQTPFSIYPASTSAVVAKVKVSPVIVLQAAVYDGKPLSYEENPYNVKRDWNLLDEIFSTAEVTFFSGLEGQLPGAYKAGLFYHNGSYNSLVSEETVKASLGGYISMQEYLIKGKSKNLGAFLQIGSAKGDGNLLDLYASGGINCQGIFKRKEDILSIGIAHSSINNDLAENNAAITLHRTLLETNYQLKINENFSLQPDLQYIINPGAQSSLYNTFIGIIRFSIQY